MKFKKCKKTGGLRNIVIFTYYFEVGKVNLNVDKLIQLTSEVYK